MCMCIQYIHYHQPSRNHNAAYLPWHPGLERASTWLRGDSPSSSPIS